MVDNINVFLVDDCPHISPVGLEEFSRRVMYSRLSIHGRECQNLGLLSEWSGDNCGGCECKEVVKVT